MIRTSNFRKKQSAGLLLGSVLLVNLLCLGSANGANEFLQQIESISDPVKPYSSAEKQVKLDRADGAFAKKHGLVFLPSKYWAFTYDKRDFLRMDAGIEATKITSYIEQYFNGDFRGVNRGLVDTSNIRSLLMAYSEKCGAKLEGYGSTVRKTETTEDEYGQEKLYSKQYFYLPSRYSRTFINQEEGDYSVKRHFSMYLDMIRNPGHAMSSLYREFDSLKVATIRMNELVRRESCDSAVVYQLMENMFRAVEGIPSLQNERIGVVAGASVKMKQPELLFFDENRFGKVNFVFANPPEQFTLPAPKDLLELTKKKFGRFSTEVNGGKSSDMRSVRITIKNSHWNGLKTMDVGYRNMIGWPDNSSGALKLLALGMNEKWDKNLTMGSQFSDRIYADFAAKDGGFEKMMVDCRYQNGAALIYWLDQVPEGSGRDQLKEVYQYHPLLAVQSPIKTCPPYLPANYTLQSYIYDGRLYDGRGFDKASDYLKPRESRANFVASLNIPFAIKYYPAELDQYQNALQQAEDKYFPPKPVYTEEQKAIRKANAEEMINDQLYGPRLRKSLSVDLMDRLHQRYSLFDRKMAEGDVHISKYKELLDKEIQLLECIYQSRQGAVQKVVFLPTGVNLDIWTVYALASNLRVAGYVDQCPGRYKESVEIKHEFSMQLRKDSQIRAQEDAMKKSARLSSVEPPENISVEFDQLQLKTKLEPVYPVKALNEGLGEVAVRIQLFIDVSGEVTFVKVENPRNTARFLQSARDAGKSMVFEPYIKEGEAIPVQTRVTLQYTEKMISERKASAVLVEQIVEGVRTAKRKLKRMNRQSGDKATDPFDSLKKEKEIVLKCIYELDGERLPERLFWNKAVDASVLQGLPETHYFKFLKSGVVKTTCPSRYD